jgi:trk system potassium uptake protein TrkH
VNSLLDLKILGWLLASIGAVECVPLAMAVAFGEPLYPLAAGALVSGVVGMSLAFAAQPVDDQLRARDGFLVVSMGWILASLFGALPYVLGDVLSPVDAIFEAVAGFTTTGSTVMTDIEGVPRSILLWRAITQWLGGMGIIVFALAILPLLGIGGMQLFKAEMPGPTADKLRPRIAQTARRLLFVYVGFTALEVVLLCTAGLGVYDAVCHALTTLSTGGFSTRDASVGAFASPMVEWIVIAFMLCGGMNFALHYRMLSGQVRTVLRDTEIRYFLGVVAVAAAAVAVMLVDAGQEPGRELRTALFHVVSIMTTTGYGTADFEVWPVLAQLFLLQLMFLGGMTGSTSGGVKDLRVILGFRVLRGTIARGIHPHSVPMVKYGGHAVPLDVLSGIWSFLTAYVALAILATAVMAAYGFDLVSSASAALTALGNVGPGLGAVGPTETFAEVPAPAKLMLAFCMLAGRLEIFTIVMLLVPDFWRR